MKTKPVLLCLLILSLSYPLTTIWTLSSSRKVEKGRVTHTFSIRRDISGTFLGPAGYVTPEVDWAYDFKIFGPGPNYEFKNVSAHVYVGDTLKFTSGFIRLDKSKGDLEIHLKTGRKKVPFSGNGKYSIFP